VQGARGLTGYGGAEHAVTRRLERDTVTSSAVVLPEPAPPTTRSRARPEVWSPSPRAR
jgi:hypothetical protein